jgi:hypothetical protein
MRDTFTRSAPYSAFTVIRIPAAIAEIQFEKSSVKRN